MIISNEFLMINSLNKMLNISIDKIHHAIIVFNYINI